MVIHSGSILLLLAYLVSLLAVIGLLSSVAILIARKSRLAAKVAVASVGTLVVYLVVATVISSVAPQRVINVGDSYCWDLWCMGIERVSATPRGKEIEYKVDVHIFSDAKTVKTSSDDAAIYLLDDRGRRYPMIQDPGVIPINTPLSPGQKINTSLTFVAPADAGHLFLTGEAPLPEHIPYAWRIFKIYADLHFGYEQLAHKPTVLRVV